MVQVDGEFRAVEPVLRNFQPPRFFLQFYIISRMGIKPLFQYLDKATQSQFKNFLLGSLTFESNRNH